MESVSSVSLSILLATVSDNAAGEAPELADVLGQRGAVDALIVAAAGGALATVSCGRYGLDVVTTFGESIPFWTAIAQVAPVLALALGLEARTLARRMSKRRSGIGPQWRTAWIVWLAITATLLVVTLPLALASLMALPTRSLSENAYENVVFALAGVINAMLFLVFTPVLRVTMAASWSPPAALLARLPWTRTARLRKLMRTADADLVRIGDDLRALRHSGLIRKADLLIRISKSSRMRDSSQAVLDRGALTHSQTVSARSHVGEQTRYIAECEELLAEVNSVLDDIRLRARHVRKQRRNLAKWSTELDRIIRDNDQIREKQLRRDLARAAKA